MIWAPYCPEANHRDDMYIGAGCIQQAWPLT